MFDTMTMTKTIGAICGTLLVFLFVNWAGNTLYGFGEETSEGEEEENAFIIETAEVETEEPVEETIDIAAILALASAEKGAKVFGKCAACHSVDAGVNRVGPTLFGLVDRDVASVAGYNYTDALLEVAGNWTPEVLFNFLEDPRAYAPGTRMTVSVAKPQDRANLIAYLGTVGN